MGIQETYSTENLVKKAIIDNGDGTTSINTNAKINVDTVNLTAEMKVDSGHDLYEATTVARVANLQVSIDAIVGLTLAKIQSVENKTQGWVYNTKGATVTNTGITLVAANQNAGYPVIGVADEIEVIYRGTSRLTDGTQVSNVQGIYNATEPSLSDGDKAQLQLNEAGELKVTGGAGASSVSAEFVSPSDFTATYTSSSTITLSGVPFTVTNSSQVAYIKQVKSDNTSRTYVNGANDITIKISSNVITVYEKGVAVTSLASGDVYEVGLNSQRKAYDASTNSTMVSPLKNVWNQYTSEQTLIEDGALTATFTQIGSDIDIRSYPILQAGVVVSVGTSTDITLKIVQKLADGSYIPINGYSDITLTESKSYKFDLPAIETVAFQVKDAAAGTGTVSLYYNQAWR
jgi:hypothetical protein